MKDRLQRNKSQMRRRSCRMDTNLTSDGVQGFWISWPALMRRISSRDLCMDFFFLELNSSL